MCQSCLSMYPFTPGAARCSEGCRWGAGRCLSPLSASAVGSETVCWDGGSMARPGFERAARTQWPLQGQERSWGTPDPPPLFCLLQQHLSHLRPMAVVKRPTNWGASNNGSLFPHSSGGQSPKSRCQEVGFLLEAQRENLSQPVSLVLVAPAILGDPWLADTSLQSLLLMTAVLCLT